MSVWKGAAESGRTHFDAAPLQSTRAQSFAQQSFSAATKHAIFSAGYFAPFRPSWFVGARRVSAVGPLERAASFTNVSVIEMQPFSPGPFPPRSAKEVSIYIAAMRFPSLSGQFGRGALPEILSAV